MTKLVKEIERLGRVLVFLWMEEGMTNDEAQEAVLVVIKEHLDTNDKTTFTKENLNECILTMKTLLV
jgi:purine nucleoside phosphorylase